MSDNRQRIGIMGGTFDPIHIGHLVVAEAVRIEYHLEEILFIPAAEPPHKQQMEITPAQHRYLMTVMATCSNPHFQVSPIELERRGPSYTVDTAIALRKIYGTDTMFYFITGADAVLELASWKDIGLLLELCHFVAVTRPGSVEQLNKVIHNFGTQGKERIHRLDIPLLDISSTDIRERIKGGRSIKYIVPENVENYILKERLYQNDVYPM